jgi:Flp pilus assembly protein TadB
MSAIIIQIISLILILIIIIIISNIISTVQKEKRIADYALSITSDDDTSLLTKLNHAFWSFIHQSSKSLGKSKILDALAHDYDKYILIDEENYKSGIDYLTVKIMTTIISVIALIILILVNLIPSNLLILILFIILGYVLPDLFWSFNYNIKCHDIQTKLYQSIILISDNLKNNTIDEAINKTILELDGPIKEEYRRILLDMSYGLDINTAFKRFYERTKISEVKIIDDVLAINAQDIKKSFALIRTKFEYLQTKRDIIDPVNSALNILSNVYLLIPVIFILMVVIIYPDYFKIVTKVSTGYIVICSLILLYVTLVIVIKWIGDERK